MNWWGIGVAFVLAFVVTLVWPFDWRGNRKARDPWDEIE